MKRGVVILKNSIRCKNCGDVLVSRSRHDWVCCKCFQESRGKTGCYCDGGTSYLRYGGDAKTYDILTETRPMTDEEVEIYNKKEDEKVKKYGWYTPSYME